MNIYDVHVPQIATHLPASAVQKGILAEMQDGAKLVGTFDVYGGYDWLLKRPNGMTSRVKRATIQGLVDRHLIVKGDSVRVASGSHEIPFTLKPTK